MGRATLEDRTAFYPYLTLALFWLFGAALPSLAVGRPGIRLLGLATLPSLFVVFLATYKTWKEPEASLPGPRLSTSPAFEKRFAVIVLGLLLVLVTASTFLHHAAPEVLRVPSNADAASWRNPAFNETTLFDRMTPDQRARVAAHGLPWGQSLMAQLGLDLFPFFLGLLCFLHARKHYGLTLAMCFFAGSFLFTGLEETLWILIGRSLSGETLNPLGQAVSGTYWFTRGGLWFLETPAAACVGWFFVAYSSVLAAGRAFPRLGLTGRAVVGGLVAMGIDLWLDPVATSPEILSWVWARGDVLLVFGIPHTNFLGWFLLVFLFALFWEGLPGLAARFGPARGTALFFALLMAAEAGILVFFGLWTAILGGVLKMAGATSAVHWPRGW